MVEKTTTEIIKDQIKRTLSREEVPVRLAVYALDGKFLAYKADSCWGLDKEKIKIHDLSQSGKRGNLARNLLYFFQETNKNSLGSENCWMKRFPQGVKVVVEDISDLSNPKKALEYQITKQADKYILN